MRTYRPRDHLPRVLRDEASRVAAARQHHLAAYWSGAVASAAALVDVWARTGKHGAVALPPPLSWSDLADPVEIRWTQTLAEEAQHQELIQVGGSSRTGVLVAAATRYVAAGGDTLALMRDTPGQLTPGPLTPAEAEVLGLFDRCPAGCPVRVAADRLPCWATRLLSTGVS